MQLKLLLIFLLFSSQMQAQQIKLQDSSKQNYLSDLKKIGKTFTAGFYPNYAKIYSLPQEVFIKKIDSVRKEFNALLNSYKNQLDTPYIREQLTEIKYYFDRLLIEYPLNHDVYMGKTNHAISSIPEKLKSNLADFNRVDLLSNSDFTNYAKSFFAYQINLELRKPIYKNTDNQQLNAVWNIIPKFVSNQHCKDFWKCNYLFDHIDNNGIKNIKDIYLNFKSTCADTACLNKVKIAYAEDSAGREGHLIKTYKTVGPFNLDIHIFLPDSLLGGSKKPVIIYFHGGSWSEGKPDWFFEACKSYAQKGWVACAVEYRIYGREGTLPFEAVKDAKSSIRWLRQHAKEYNIDTNRIVASGNSAGAHLVLCTALTDKWNEKTDDLKFSCIPNALMINSGVYDLTDQNTAWIRKDLKNKSLVKEISPVYLIKNNFPPSLIIHGTADQNVPYSSAEKFVTDMKKTGNNTIEFQSLNGAGHFIWLDPKYVEEVSKLRSAFLNKLGY